MLWTIYGTIAKSGQGLHPDMTELLDWSRDLAWGYKHPPLAAALVRLWFSVFPVAEWSYYLLAMLMPAIALWIVWRLSADYLEIEKRVFGIALLTLVPFFNFHALKFNVNTVLMPLWAATTLWFLRSYTTRSALYAALAGIGAAACHAGQILVDLPDRRAGRRRAGRQTPRGLFPFGGALDHGGRRPRRAGAASGLDVRHDFAPFAYAVGVHGAKPLAETVVAALGYLAGSAGYVAVPAIIALVAGRPSRATLADMVWPADPDRRLAAAAFWATVAAAGVAARGERHRHHLALVDVGLDAVAGAAAVAAGDDDLRRGHAPPARLRGGAAAGHADRVAGDLAVPAAALALGGGPIAVMIALEPACPACTPM